MALRVVVSWPRPIDAAFTADLRGAFMLPGAELDAQPGEAGLRRSLETQAADVWHYRGALRSRGAQYITLLFEDSQRRSRQVALAALAPALGALELVVLEASNDVAALQAAAQTLLRHGVKAVVAVAGGTLDYAWQPFYAALQTQPLAQALRALGSSAHLHCAGDMALAFATSATPAATAVVAVPAQEEVAAAAAPPDPLAELLRAKRATGRFDVFLCHNSADKPAVKRIGLKLKEAGILPWLDEWELPPGQAWQPLLEQQIERIASAAVFFGAAGSGPWHQQEMRGFIEEFVHRQLPLIPVLLEGSPPLPALPIFLRGLTWVDFRRAEPDPFERLLWGITQQRRDERP